MSSGYAFGNQNQPWLNLLAEGGALRLEQARGLSPWGRLEHPGGIKTCKSFLPASSWPSFPFRLGHYLFSKFIWKHFF